MKDSAVYIGYQTLIVINCISVVGYFIFRLSNSQKNLFRKDPNNPKVARKSNFCRFIDNKDGFI